MGGARNGSATRARVAVDWPRHRARRVHGAVGCRSLGVRELWRAHAARCSLGIRCVRRHPFAQRPDRDVARAARDRLRRRHRRSRAVVVAVAASRLREGEHRGRRRLRTGLGRRTGLGIDRARDGHTRAPARPRAAADGLAVLDSCFAAGGEDAARALARAGVGRHPMPRRGADLLAHGRARAGRGIRAVCAARRRAPRRRDDRRVVVRRSRVAAIPARNARRARVRPDALREERLAHRAHGDAALRLRHRHGARALRHGLRLLRRALRGDGEGTLCGAGEVDARQLGARGLWARRHRRSQHLPRDLGRTGPARLAAHVLRDRFARARVREAQPHAAPRIAGPQPRALLRSRPSCRAPVDGRDPHAGSADAVDVARPFVRVAAPPTRCGAVA